MTLSSVNCQDELWSGVPGSGWAALEGGIGGPSACLGTVELIETVTLDNWVVREDSIMWTS